MGFKIFQVFAHKVSFDVWKISQLAAEVKLKMNEYYVIELKWENINDDIER